MYENLAGENFEYKFNERGKLVDVQIIGSKKGDYTITVTKDSMLKYQDAIFEYYQREKGRNPTVDEISGILASAAYSKVLH